MEAQKFKTAKELGIAQDWYNGLILTLEALEKGEIKHLTGDELEALLERTDGLLPPDLRAFNMGVWRNDYNCGTVSCLGGTAEMLGKCRFTNLDDHRELYALFHPMEFTDHICDWDKITTDQSIMALRSYLTHGDARWGCILGYEKEPT